MPEDLYARRAFSGVSSARILYIECSGGRKQKLGFKDACKFAQSESKPKSLILHRERLTCHFSPLKDKDRA